MFSRLRRVLTSGHNDGLSTLRERLGMHDRLETQPPQHPAPISVHKTSDVPHSVVYGPDIDGHAEPGEVVWLWVLIDGPQHPPQERALLVVARAEFQHLLGLLISSNEAHANDPDWLSIGPGQWDATGKPAWMRLDKIVEVPEDHVRREGALFPERRFRHVAQRLRSEFGWV